MTEQEYKKVEFYLYNYHKINYLIKIRETDLIDSINVSNNAWIKSIKDTSNTMEEQAIKIIDDNLIKEYKEWQVFLKKILVFLCNKNFLLYNIAVLYYMENENLEYILKTLKIDLKDFILLDKKLISLIYKNAEIRNMV